MMTSRTRQPHTPDPNSHARSLTGRDYLSYSAISSYQRCPLCYYFTYIAGAIPAFKSSSLIFGSAIHAALELHCRRIFEGLEPPSLDELVAAYQQSWASDATLPIKFGKDETAESLRDLASRMLAAFQASAVSQLDTRLLAVEEEFRAAMIADCPDLLGRVDLVTCDDTTLRITDFKTSRSRWSTTKVQESAPQMLLYGELLRPLASQLGLDDVRLEWIVITKAKQPVVETHTLTPQPAPVARTKAVIRRVWRAISAGHFYPSPSAMSCAGCAYADPCRSWNGQTTAG